MFTKALFTLFLALAALPAHALEAKAPATPTAPALAPLAPIPATPTAPAPEAKIPDTSNMLFVQNLRKAGTTIYYLGEALGMNGWFALKDKQIQIFYTSADNRAILVGALLSPEGANISQQQLALFAKDHPDIMEMMKNASSQPAPDAETAPPPASAEQVYAELSKAAHVTFGKAGAPAILMVMDINCPHCHKTWKVLEKAVNEGKLGVIMIPVPALGAASAQEEALWLAAKDPQGSFKKHVGGDAKILAGTASPDQLVPVAKNMELIQRFKINETPTILYRGKNGKVRLIVGEPQNSDVILSDIGG